MVIIIFIVIIIIIIMFFMTIMCMQIITILLFLGTTISIPIPNNHTTTNPQKSNNYNNASNNNIGGGRGGRNEREESENRVAQIQCKDQERSLTKNDQRDCSSLCVPAGALPPSPAHAPVSVIAGFHRHGDGAVLTQYLLTLTLAREAEGRDRWEAARHGAGHDHRLVGVEGGAVVPRDDGGFLGWVWGHPGKLRVN